MDTTSYWKESQALPRFPRLDRDREVDVVVVGAGITGVTAAFLLQREGRRVLLLDRGRAVEADTGHTSAHLTCAIDLSLTELASSFGDDHARATWDAGLAAIARIDELVRTQGIDCDFGWTRGYLHTPTGVEPTDDDRRRIKDEVDVAAKLGFGATYVERAPFVERPAMVLEGQARFHPRRYLRALLDVINGDGKSVCEHTAVTEITDDPLTVIAGGHKVRCEDVVVATHNPIVGLAGMTSAAFLQTKLSLYTSYVVGARAPKGAVPDALFWDTGDPYRYLRVDPHRDFDYIILGGEDHKTGQVEDTRRCYAAIESAFAELVPDAHVLHRWSGQVIETDDGLPLIGYTAPHQFAATGFSGNGMTFGTVGAMMAADAIAGRANPWRDLFAIDRTKIRGAAWDYIKENKDYPYYMIRDRFAGAEGRSLRGLARGAGKILDLDGRRVAAYRDVDGRVTLRSPICTHLGCTVRWNTAERTWDCPCHGSRFAPSGQVLSGPAESPLAEAPPRVGSS